MVTWVGWWCLYKRGSSPGLDPTFDRGLAEAADKSEASTKTLHTARSAAREGSSPVVQWTPPRSMTHPRSSASSLQGHNRTMTDWGRAAKGKGDVSDRGTRQGGPSRAGLWTEPDRTVAVCKGCSLSSGVNICFLALCGGKIDENGQPWYPLWIHHTCPCAYI